MDDLKSGSGTLIIKDRKTLTLNGVKNVLGFDDGYVSIESELGKLTVEGKDLKIESLTKEDGIIVVTGKIDGAYFNEQKPSKSVFSSFFK